MPKQKIIIISGPTASGKTEISLALAKKYNSYIISADSRQIYKNMDIGTAKTNGEDKVYETGIDDIKTAYYIDDIPHFLINSITPNTDYSLSDWQKQANDLLNSETLQKQFSIPMIVGGTGLYINSITDEYILPKGETDEQLRHFLNEQPLEKIQQQLKEKSIETYESIDIHNHRRIVRALEYVLTNKKAFIPEKNTNANKYDILHLGIKTDREYLYNNINKRVDTMVTNGLVNEVENLLKNYDKNLPSLSGIGYAEIIEYLDKKISLDEAIKKIKQHTRQFAKRQITWFKRDNKIKWISGMDEAAKQIEKFIK